MNSKTKESRLELYRLQQYLAQACIIFILIVSSVIHAKAQSLSVPNFWDPNERFLKPELSTVPRLKFLTTTDFPPFNFIDRKKRLSGFHVDLARAICLELDLLTRCQIQALPWDEIDSAIEKGDGEAIIAGLAVTSISRDKYKFSRPYLHIPARFITRNSSELFAPIYDSLFKKTVGVVESSSHESYFSDNFGERNFLAFPTRQLAFNALKAGQVDAVFTDALSASFWLASASADNCCKFIGGPYLSDKYFGHGLAIATARDNPLLIEGINYALKSIYEKGVFEELYLRYFPLGLY